VGLTTDNEIAIVTTEVIDGMVEFNTTGFEVEGIPEFNSVNINGNGDRLSFCGGGDGDNPDLAVFEFEVEIEEECDETVITAEADSATGCPGESFTISAETLLSNDSNTSGEALEIQDLSFDNPEDGTIVDNEDGTWTITPGADFTGDITLSYTAIINNGSLVFEDNGHLYQFISSDAITWQEARDAASSPLLRVKKKIILLPRG